MARHAANTPSGVASAQHVSWDHFQVFFALAQAKSTREAGAQLGLNASTISRKVAALERALGARLFERHPDGLRLTVAGSDVLDAASRMSEFVGTMARRVVGADRNLVGTVRVTTPEVIAQPVAEVLARVREEHRGLELEFRVDDQIANLERHEADVAVRVSNMPPSDLVGRKLGRVGVGVYGSESYLSSHPFELDDERHQWVEWPAYAQRKGAYAWLNERVPTRRVAVRASSAQAVLAAASAGLGLALLVHVHARRSAALASRWALPEEYGTDVWALSHREVRKNARVRAVLAALGSLRW